MQETTLKSLHILKDHPKAAQYTWFWFAFMRNILSLRFFLDPWIIPQDWFHCTEADEAWETKRGFIAALPFGKL